VRLKPVSVAASHTESVCLTRLSPVQCWDLNTGHHDSNTTPHLLIHWPGFGAFIVFWSKWWNISRAGVRAEDVRVLCYSHLYWRLTKGEKWDVSGLIQSRHTQVTWFHLFCTHFIFTDLNVRRINDISEGLMASSSSSSLERDCRRVWPDVLVKLK